MSGSYVLERPADGEPYMRELTPLSERDRQVPKSLLEAQKAGRPWFSDEEWNKSKRKASEEPAAPQSIDDIDSDDERLAYITDNCDQVRRKINNFINSGEMKVGEFQKAIGVSGNSYRTFLGQSGKTTGMGSNTYSNAATFFKKRELMGLKPPRKTVKKTKTGDEAGGGKGKAQNAAEKFDVSSIHLDGEEDVSIPVYETCDGIRNKIRAHLRDPGVTQAGFLREISKTFPEGKTLSSGTLNGFLGKKGPKEGSTSQVFYAAYVFFEKLRIRDGKPKSNFREEMEDAWGPKGFDRWTSPSTGYWCHVSSEMYVNEYGQVRTRPSRRR